MNELEKDSLRELQKTIPGCSHMDLIVRCGGKDWHFEVDFLKKVIMALPVDDETHRPLIIKDGKVTGFEHIKVTAEHIETTLCPHGHPVKFNQCGFCNNMKYDPQPGWRS